MEKVEDITKEHSSNTEEQVEQVETNCENSTEDTNEVVQEDTSMDQGVDSKESDSNKEDDFGKKADEYLDRLKRTMAEFDNYRKRTDKEKASMYDMGVCDTVLNILPVIDNFERALAAPCEDSSYVKGMEMIYKQMIDLLDSINVKQIEALGQSFDTDIHNAVMHVEDDNYGENEIIEEFQKGYIYKDEKVIRYSMVKVAN